MAGGVGQAKVFTADELTRVFQAIGARKHPERNLCVVLLSFSLGLRAQEIALLENQFLLDVGDQYPAGFEVASELVLPARVTKGARATASGPDELESDPEERKMGRRSVRFSIPEFDQLVKRIVADGQSGKTIEPTDYYPPRPKKKSKTRTLPLVDPLLRQAIHNYTLVKLDNQSRIYKKSPFIVSQKDGGYSPNTMQQLMAKIYRDWAGIKGASSHSGRRTFATTLLKKENESVKVVQALLGHRSAATTIIYEEEPTELEKESALSKSRVRIH